MNNQTDIQQESEIHLRDYYRVIKKRKIIVLTFALVTFAVVLLGTLAQTPLYEASVRVLIERNYDAEVMGQGYMPYDPEFYGTQFNIIQSRNVVGRVVDKLKLDTVYRNYFLEKEQTSLLHPVKTWLKGIGSFFVSGQPAEENGSADVLAALIVPASDAELITKIIQEELAAKPVIKTKIVEITYRHENPALAQLVVDNIAKAYMDEMLEIKMNASNYAIEWMTIKADEEKKKLASSENVLQRYTREHDVVTVENKMTIIPQRLNEFASQLSKAQAEMRDLNDLQQQIRNAGDDYASLEAIPVFSANKALQTLRDDLLKAEQQISELSKKYGPKHPLMMKAESERALLIKEKQHEIRRIERFTKVDYQIAQSKAANLSALLEETKQDLLNLKERFIQYDILKREVDTNRILYDALITRIKQQGASAQNQTVNIWVVKKADLPIDPASPRTKRNMLLALVLGVFGGTGMAFFVEYLDNTVKSPDDIERRIGLPILGVIAQPDQKDQDINTITRDNPKSLMAESYRSLRSQVLLSSAEKPPQTILVCSVAPKEGKTTTAANFARTLAESENSVLIIDCDLRKPRLHKVFNQSNALGLSNYLTGSSEVAPIIEVEGEAIHILASGPIPPNPSELLASGRMKKLLAEMALRYDFIVIDSPPVMSVTDSQILSKMADGTLLVTRFGQTTWDQIQHGVKLFTDIKAHVLGVVLNGVVKGQEGGYYYQGYYSYYGDDDHSSKQ
jgi:succinoglycan biosynthesis transport protein ExoP